MGARLHLVKLCVGVDRLETFQGWVKERNAIRSAAGERPEARHRTRMHPRRAKELLQGGSLFWVINGVICCRQLILALEQSVDDDGCKRTDIVMEPVLVPTEAWPRRPFQGWRYLPASEAPPDMPADWAANWEGVLGDAPPALLAEIRKLGVA